MNEQEFQDLNKQVGFLRSESKRLEALVDQQSDKSGEFEDDVHEILDLMAQNFLKLADGLNKITTYLLTDQRNKSKALSMIVKHKKDVDETIKDA